MDRTNRPAGSAATQLLATAWLGAAGLGAATLLAGCSRSDWEAVRYESGDTTVVRTVDGSVWGKPRALVERARIDAEPADSLGRLRAVTSLALGPNGEVYVVDGTLPAVRAYDRKGRYVRSFVAPLGQPGHYSQPNGVTVLSDGRVVIRDPRNSQMLVYSPRGSFLERWRHPPGVYSPIPLWADEEDRIYTRVIYNPQDPREEWDEGFVRYGPDGEVRDTIPDPEVAYVPPRLLAASLRGDTAYFAVPLTPRAHWARSPTGEIVRGISDRYAIELIRPDGSVLRIEKEYEPAPASREERATLYREIDRQAKQIDYRWTWRGPVIPEEKPPFKWLFADAGGRIWVQLHQEATLRTGAAAAAGPEGEAGSLEEEGAGSEAPELPDVGDWTEPTVFDVFENDGSYLGQVRVPENVRLLPLPAIRGNTVWAAVVDEAGEPGVVRFEIE